MTNISDLKRALSAYKKRFGIEEMFRDYQSGGYNLESTGVNGERLIALLILMTLAYTSSIMSGEKIKNMEKTAMKRDEQGKFARKNDEHRSVRSVRLTDSTWEALGNAAQSQGITRADLLEQLMRVEPPSLPSNTPFLPSNTRGEGEIEQRLIEPATLKIEELETLCSNILKDLKLGKQAPGYKVVQKTLSQLLALAKSQASAM